MPKDLRFFLDKLRTEAPQEIITIEREVDPKFEVSAILQHLENRGLFPALFFKRVKNMKGKSTDFSLVTNLFATREKCALAFGFPVEKSGMEASEEYSGRQLNYIKPEIVSKEEAPVKEVVMKGDNVDLLELPVVTHHEMDAGAYLTTTVVAQDPDLNGNYNSSHHRMLIRNRNETGIYMSPRHLWNFYSRAEERDEALPIAQVVGHHPGWYLGSEKILNGIGVNEYEIIGGILDEPLRLTPSEAYGEKLLVPADAEIIIEGEILPHERDAEAPFGEFTGYYGPQKWGPIVKIKAITRRRTPIFQNIFVGHADNQIVGGIAKEGGVYKQIQSVIPTVKAVHFPLSGCCRFNVYVSIVKKNEGEPVSAALATLSLFDEIKHVIVVDDDIDVFNEREVMWAVATRFQADQGLNIIKNARGGTLDPSQISRTAGAKMIIDATKPLDRAFQEKLKVPEDVMQRVKLEEWIEIKGHSLGGDTC
jgi:UbiD family decarboxylase